MPDKIPSGSGIGDLAHPAFVIGGSREGLNLVIDFICVVLNYTVNRVIDFGETEKVYFLETTQPPQLQFTWIADAEIPSAMPDEHLAFYALNPQTAAQKVADWFAERGITLEPVEANDGKWKICPKGCRFHLEFVPSNS